MGAPAPWSEPVLVVAALVGVLVGLSLGTLGGGGSIMTVPILVYVFGQDPRAATTGSLVVVGITALAGALAHARAGRVRAFRGMVFGAIGVPGAMLGAQLSASIDGHLLLIAFAVLMLAAAAAMLTRWWRTGRHQPDPGPEPVETPQRPMILVVAAATGVGLLTGFLGVGGGFLVVPALVLVLGMPMPEAVGTSLLVITITSVAALITRLGQHITLDWHLLAGFTAAATLSALAGGRLLPRLRPGRLTVAFAVLLLAVATYTGATSLAILP